MILVVFFFNEFIPCIHGKVFDSGNLLPVYIREGDWEGEILSRIYTEWALNVLTKWAVNFGTFDLSVGTFDLFENLR